MAIKYGKGIRGFLGRIPTSNYQYTPMPFNEMLAMGQLADRRANQNLQQEAQVNRLFSQPLLQKDRERADELYNNFNTELTEVLSESGGNLSNSKVSRYLTQKRYDLLNDPVVLNGADAIKRHRAYETKIMSQVGDRSLRPLYINKSLDRYNNSATGALYSPYLDYSTMSENTFDSNLYSVASKLKADKTTKLFEEDGSQQLVSTEILSPEEIFGSLVSYMNENSNMQRYAKDKAEVLGLGYEDFLKGKFQNISNDLSVENIKEGKLTESTQGSIADTPYVHLGNAFPVSVDETLGFTGETKVQNYVKALNTNKENLQPAEYAIKRSTINAAMEEVGLNDEDLKTIENGSSYEDNRPFVEVPSGFGTFRRVRQGMPTKKEETAHGRFEKGIEKLLENATIIPQIVQFTDKSIKPPQKRAIEALNNSLEYIPSLVVTQTMNKEKKWEAAGEQKDYNFNNLKIEGISNRPYFDPTLGPIVKVRGKLNSGTKEQQIFEGDLPVSALESVNRDLGAIYDSPTMRDASRLMIKGTSVTGKTFEAATQYLREQEKFKDETYIQDPNNVFSIVLKKNGKYSVVLTDKATTKVIPGQAGEYTREYTTLTEAAAYIDSLVIESLNER